ncbi:FKBP-type peptidyl-prolyl cis-trans isomerase [bacterium A37T11]|nr:FKBP-type peptidyl-prolyl cis-trans isomerase [bacterium A37T11]
MKKTILMLSLAAFAVTACQQFKDGKGGLKYKIIHSEGKEKPQAGDAMFVSMVVKTESDSVLNSTYDVGLPQYIQIPPDTIPGTYPGDQLTMFKMLGEGDSAIFKINLDTMAAKTGQPKPPIFKGSYVVFDIKINKLFKKGQLTDSAFRTQLDAYYKGLIEKVKTGEDGKLNAYIQKEGLKTQKTASGLQYVIKEEGKGVKPNVGDTVKINYTGKLIGGTGKVFDTNIKEVAQKEKTFNAMRPYEPMKIPVGVGAVIPGWDEGLVLLSKGTKATLIIPSKLAYGEQGAQGAIPPFSPLAFDVEVVDVIAKKPGSDTTKTLAPPPALQAPQHP